MWKGQLIHLWLRFSASNDSCQTSSATSVSPPLSLQLPATSACCSGRNACTSPVLRAAGSMLGNLSLTATVSSGAWCLLGMEQGGGGKGEWRWQASLHGFVFCLAMVTARLQLTISLCSISASVTGYNHSMCWPFRQECLFYFFAPQGCRVCILQGDSSPALTTRSELLACNCDTNLDFPISFLPYLPQFICFRCFNMQIFQTCFCIEQGILC